MCGTVMLRGIVMTHASSGRGQSKSLVLTAMIFAVAMTFIDQTIVSIAAPTVQHDLGLSSSGMQWAVNARAPGTPDLPGWSAAPGSPPSSCEGFFAYPVTVIVAFAYEMTMITPGMQQMRHALLSKGGRRVTTAERQIGHTGAKRARGADWSGAAGGNEVRRWSH
jgi:hypothetical protein